MNTLNQKQKVTLGFHPRPHQGDDPPGPAIAEVTEWVEQTIGASLSWAIGAIAVRQWAGRMEWAGIMIWVTPMVWATGSEVARMAASDYFRYPGRATTAPLN